MMLASKSYLFERIKRKAGSFVKEIKQRQERHEWMNLKDLISVLDVTKTYHLKDIPICDVEYSYKAVKKNSVFLNCDESDLPNTGGHKFIEESLKKGAIAFVVSTEFDERRKSDPEYKRSFESLKRREIPVIVVPNTAKAVSNAAAHFFRYPSRQMSVVGVTGTNGKTTVTYILEHILKKAGNKTGVVGTISYRNGGKVIPHMGYTTPTSLQLQRIMDTMVKDHVTHFLMEVSSQGLEQDRVSGIDFDIAIFNHLTQDHLDFHQTMENYFNAKKKLFTQLLPASAKKIKYAIINSDCEYGRQIATETRVLANQNIHTLTFSFDDDQSDLQVKKYHMNGDGMSFSARIFDATYDFQIPLVGKHNIYNAIASILACHGSLGMKISDLQNMMKDLPHVPGRLERIGKGYNIFVDYAHTDDALKNAITSLRSAFPDKKITTVFGCGGDRDSRKRPLMGRVVGDLSDFAVVTTDNPRYEHPDKIIQDIVAGMNGSNYVIIPDRKEAIEKVISGMNPLNDVVLIAGKGHEEYQEIKGVKQPFSDVKIAEKAVKGIAS